MMQAYYWLVLFAILIVIELITVGLTTIWFAGGAVVSFFTALAGVNVYMQIIIFLLVSVLLLVTTRPIAIKYFVKDKEKTNVETLPGKEGQVIEAINNLEGTGKVNLNGMEWTARTEDLKEQIEKGTIVKVLRVEGVKLIVEKGE